MAEEPEMYKYRYVGIIGGWFHFFWVFALLFHHRYVRVDAICNVVMNYFVSC
jgi:hypothetical protein